MTTAHGVSQADTLIGGGVALATIGGVIMGVGASQAASSHLDVWFSPWFDGGCALVACGVQLVVLTLIASWRRARKSRKEIQDGEGMRVDTPVPGAEPALSPLDLLLVDENWRLSYSAVWVFALAVRVINITEKPIILAHYYLQSRPGEGPRPPLAQEVWNSVNSSKAGLSVDHKSKLFAGEITVSPGEAVIRWHIDTAYIPLPDGGRPHCTFRIKDTLNNTYELDIPARAPKTYRSLKAS